MTPNVARLPVPVLEHPHWRVNFRPNVYRAEAVPSLSECFQIVEKNKVTLRGWDYPHLSHRDTERTQGVNWVASWAAFMGHLEYWRFYQSTQFLHLFSVREATEERWRSRLQELAAFHLSHITDVDWEKVPGFISMTNFLYNVTDIVEFATRLCQAQVYKGDLNISIQVSQIRGFVLTTDTNRMWDIYCSAGEDSIAKTWTINCESLVGDSPRYSLDIVVWFLERFGWLNPSRNVLSKDIDNYLKGRH